MLQRIRLQLRLARKPASRQAVQWQEALPAGRQRAWETSQAVPRAPRAEAKPGRLALRPEREPAAARSRRRTRLPDQSASRTAFAPGRPATGLPPRRPPGREWRWVW
ncbi:MAG: hypothetical protein ACREMH_07085, partial [Gemmatimonadales bacterium]